MASQTEDTLKPDLWGGIYVLSETGSAPYKLGIALNYQHRFSSYMTCYPNSFHYYFLLGFIPSASMLAHGARVNLLTNLFFRQMETEIGTKLRSRHKCIPYGQKKGEVRSCEWFDDSLGDIFAVLVQTLQKYAGSELYLGSTLIEPSLPLKMKVFKDGRKTVNEWKTTNSELAKLLKISTFIDWDRLTVEKGRGMIITLPKTAKTIKVSEKKLTKKGGRGGKKISLLSSVPRLKKLKKVQPTPESTKARVVRRVSFAPS